MPFNQADPTTYPYRFGVSMGQFDFTEIDHRASGYIQDKWEISRKLTLNLGVRYDWQKATPETHDAIGPRVGLAYDLTGDGKTLVRGGFGKVYQYQQLAILATLVQRSHRADAGMTQRRWPSATGTFGQSRSDRDFLSGVVAAKAGEAAARPARPP